MIIYRMIFLKPYTILTAAICSAVFLVSNIRGFMPIPPQIMERIQEIPIEEKLNMMHLSYMGRQALHTIGISQQIFIRLVEETEWSELDYFNILVAMSAIYALFKNMEEKGKMDKLFESGILDRKSARKRGIIFFVMFTVLFRDVENAI